MLRLREAKGEAGNQTGTQKQWLPKGLVFSGLEPEEASFHKGSTSVSKHMQGVAMPPQVAEKTKDTRG